GPARIGVRTARHEIVQTRLSSLGLGELHRATLHRAGRPPAGRAPPSPKQGKIRLNAEPVRSRVRRLSTSDGEGVVPVLTDELGTLAGRLWRRRVLILLVTLVCAAAGWYST